MFRNPTRTRTVWGSLKLVRNSALNLFNASPSDHLDADESNEEIKENDLENDSENESEAEASSIGTFVPSEESGLDEDINESSRSDDDRSIDKSHQDPSSFLSREADMLIKTSGLDANDLLTTGTRRKAAATSTQRSLRKTRNRDGKQPSLPRPHSSRLSIMQTETCLDEEQCELNQRPGILWKKRKLEGKRRKGEIVEKDELMSVVASGGQSGSQKRKRRRSLRDGAASAVNGSRDARGDNVLAKPRGTTTLRTPPVRTRNQRSKSLEDSLDSLARLQIDSLAGLPSQETPRKRRATTNERSDDEPSGVIPSKRRRSVRWKMDRTGEQCPFSTSADVDDDSVAEYKTLVEQQKQSLKLVTVPEFNSAHWKIWRKLTNFNPEKPASLATTCQRAMDNAAGLQTSTQNQISVVGQWDLSHNFRVLYRAAASRLAAGMCCSAVQLCHDVLIAWYAEAQDAIVQIHRCPAHRERMVVVLKSLRTSLAGMWCVYAHVLMELGTRTDELAANRTGRRNPFGADEPSASEVDLIKHALSVLANAACCPLVGNHPWISIARSRIILLRAVASHGLSWDTSIISIDEETSDDAVQERSELIKLSGNIASAIRICSEGIHKSTPLPHLAHTGSGTSEQLQSTSVVACLGRYRPSRPSFKDTVSSIALERSFTSLGSLVPKLQSLCSRKYLFVDKQGAMILCNEVNRLSRLHEESENAASIGFKHYDSPGEVSYGLEDLPHFRALDINRESFQALIPLGSERRTSSFLGEIESTVPNTVSFAPGTFDSLFLETSDVPSDHKIVESGAEENSSETTPVLITSDAGSDEGCKNDCDMECALRQVKKPVVSHAEEPARCSFNDTSVQDVEVSSDGPGSACFQVEYGCKVCLFAVYGSEKKRDLHQDHCKKKIEFQSELQPRRFGTSRLRDDFCRSFDPEEGRSYSIGDLTDLLDYAVELFAVNEGELSSKGTESPSTDSESFSPDIPNSVGQVGLRCLFCRNENCYGSDGSFTFPKSSHHLHKDMWFLCMNHLDSCKRMPRNVRQRYQEFRETVGMDSACFEDYWREAGVSSRLHEQGIYWESLHAKVS